MLYVDRFGNMQLNLTREDLDQVGIVPGTRFELEVAGERYYATAARTYADARPGEIVLYEDSYRNIAIAINRGSAAEMFVAQPGQRVRLHLDAAVTLGQRFARFATDVVVRRPALWRLFRGPMRRQFDRARAELGDDPRPDLLAPARSGARSAVGAAAARARPRDGHRGSGTPRRRALPGSGCHRRRRLRADDRRGATADRLGARSRTEPRTPSGCRSTPHRSTSSRSNNMIPFFDELARVAAPGGHLVIAFTGGSETPIYVPPERLRGELGRRGFAEFAEVSAGRGTALVARRS